MTINRFRAAAITLIGFNLAGTFLTWAAHLQRAKTGAAHAVFNGTEFTGPIVLAAIALVGLGFTYSGRRRLGTVGVFLNGLWGAGFAVGEIGELFTHNVGISSGRWDVVLAGSVVGIVVGVTTAVAAVRLLVDRRRRLQVATTTAA
jgi:hypothetical protein